METLKAFDLSWESPTFSPVECRKPILCSDPKAPLATNADEMGVKNLEDEPNEVEKSQPSEAWQVSGPGTR